MGVESPPLDLSERLRGFGVGLLGLANFVREGETVSADHPAVNGRELLFAEHDPAKPDVDAA